MASLPPITPEIEARFWSKVEKVGPDDCWPWTASTSRGYGEFWFRSPGTKNTSVQAHRVSWIIHFGAIPPRMSVRHRCRSRNCLNPTHLMLCMGNGGDDQENTRRFWAKVRRKGPNDCWIWQGAKSQYGYGTTTLFTGVQTMAHRIAWTIENGPIPEGKLIRHTCDVNSCVNPSHLLLGTHADNGRDRQERERCPRGEHHPLAILNPQKVTAIRRMRIAGATIKAIAARYGVGEGCISDIIRRRNWKHVK